MPLACGGVINDYPNTYAETHFFLTPIDTQHLAVLHMPVTQNPLKSFTRSTQEIVLT